MTTPTLFTFQKPLFDVLSSIEGVRVLETLDENAILAATSASPVLVTFWGGDKAVSSKPGATLVERTLSVYLVIGGATVATEQRDGELAFEVYNKLKDLRLPDHDQPLDYAGGSGSLEDGIRQYELQFTTRTVLRTTR